MWNFQILQQIVGVFFLHTIVGHNSWHIFFKNEIPAQYNNGPPKTHGTDGSLWLGHSFSENGNRRLFCQMKYPPNTTPESPPKPNSRFFDSGVCFPSTGNWRLFKTMKYPPSTTLGCPKTHRTDGSLWCRRSMADTRNRRLLKYYPSPTPESLLVHLTHTKCKSPEGKQTFSWLGTAGNLQLLTVTDGRPSFSLVARSLAFSPSLARSLSFLSLSRALSLLSPSLCSCYNM